MRGASARLGRLGRSAEFSVRRASVYRDSVGLFITVRAVENSSAYQTAIDFPMNQVSCALEARAHGAIMEIKDMKISEKVYIYQEMSKL